MTFADDRRTRLRNDGQPSVVVGLDFLTVDPSQRILDVHFFAPLTTDQADLLTPDRVAITATADDAPPVRVDSTEHVGGAVLRVTTAAPGGFTRYTLRVADPGDPLLVVDPPHASLELSFKAGCPRDIDCDDRPHACPPPPEIDFPVNYQARDFHSLRTALFDFAAQRYELWLDRLEADAAVMLTEVMSALGDEFAYAQDRVAREAYLETATQRRSLRRHARLVDYQVHDGLGATTWIAVTAVMDGTLTAGDALHAVRDGARVDYMIGRDLDEQLANPPASYGIKLGRNAANLVPYRWDLHDVCLPVGATSLSLAGDVTAALRPFDDTPAKLAAGRWILLRTQPADPGRPVRAHLVRVIAAEVVRDPLAQTDTTRVTWEPEQRLPFELDLTVLHVYGNLVPAVAGRYETGEFVIGTPASTLPAPGAPPAVERTGANESVAYLFSLPHTASDGLVRRGLRFPTDDPRGATPEVRLVERIPDGAGGWMNGEAWSWRASLLDSQRLDPHFTLDDGTWGRVVGYPRPGGVFEHIDLVHGDGCTIRFGDGTFGRSPARGTRFAVRYLVGNGRRANLPASAITHFDPTLADRVAHLENPFAVTSGVDPESPEEIRQLAPEAFRAVTFRAVRPEDYAEAAERLDWVQRAGCSFRWTGSWQTAFCTPDPRASVTLTADQRLALERQLDRFRQAGRETHVLAPRYADLDLEVRVCVAPTAYRSEVKARVLDALVGTPAAFFAPDRFTFGTPLDRSRLEAAIQAVPGVRAVEGARLRRRGHFAWRSFDALVFQPGLDEVIRVENDPLHPERGSVQLALEGGG